MIEAVRRTKRVVQVGMQRRSFDLFQEGKELMDRLGEVRLVNAWWVNNQKTLSQAPLAGKLDWQQWLGPAAHHPPDPVRFFSWYYFWDYSGGMMTGQGAHVIDTIHWFMNSTYPLAVTCTAGRGEPGGSGNTRDHMHGHPVSGKLSRGLHRWLQSHALCARERPDEAVPRIESPAGHGARRLLLYQQSEAAEIFRPSRSEQAGSFESAA